MIAADWIHRTHCDWYTLSTFRYMVVLCKTVRSIDDYQRNVVWRKYMNRTVYIYRWHVTDIWCTRLKLCNEYHRRVIVGAREKITPFLYKSTDLTFIVRGAVVK